MHAWRRRFALAEVVRDTVLTYAALTYAARLRRANCVIDVDVPSMLVLDPYPGKLGQLLSNLINNALMHAFAASAAPKIVISVTITPPTDAPRQHAAPA